MIPLRFIPLPSREGFCVFVCATSVGHVYKTLSGWKGRSGDLEIGPYQSKQRAGYKLAVYAGVAS